MKVDKMCSFQPALWPSSAEEEVLAESYTFYLLSSRSADSSNVY